MLSCSMLAKREVVCECLRVCMSNCMTFFGGSPPFSWCQPRWGPLQYESAEACVEQLFFSLISIQARSSTNTSKQCTDAPKRDRFCNLACPVTSVGRLLTGSRSPGTYTRPSRTSSMRTSARRASRSTATCRRSHRPL